MYIVYLGSVEILAIDAVIQHEGDVISYLIDYMYMKKSYI